MSTRRVVAVSAGLSQPSSTRLLADRLAATTTAALTRGRHPAAGPSATGPDVEVEVVELRRHAHEIVDAMLTGFAPAPLRTVLDAVGGADGLIAVTPVFSASYSGLFKSFFDVLDRDALTGTPVLLGATGGSARHSLVLEHALRPLFAHLRALVVPTAVFAAPEDWAGGEGALAERIERAGAELAAQVALHEPAAAPDPFALTTSFEQLLARD
ncbi:FMN reductase [Kineococcus xinjiangensis]|uniref:FMN reductase n=1 Tax=Kineococcus xinjiangensis TaxID=512762 RepID=A0A2S6IC24_9ACTN|nr:FMN reductase [Kineococcus xinjiangensis]PPK90786.1 FMN reductase [Kineococcus xinjiangensis]